MSAGPGVTMGPNAVSNPAALVSALRSQQPAPNPKTPLERLNPDQQALEQIKAASVSLERATQFTNDPQLLLVFNAVGGVLTKALLKFDGASVLQALQEAVQSIPPAVGPAPGAGSPAQVGPGGQPPQVGGGLSGQPAGGAPAAFMGQPQMAGA